MPYLENKDIEIVLADNRFSDTHTHDFLEIAYVAEGEAVHFINSGKTTIKKGNYFIVDYNTEHSYQAVSDKPLLIVNVLFNPRLIDKSLENCRSFNDLCRNYLIKFDTGKLKSDPTGIIFDDTDEKIGECINSLISEYFSKEAGSTEFMRCDLIRLIIRTMRKIANSAENEDLLSLICSKVGDNPASAPTLGEIADELGYSKYYLSARFKDLAGIGYRDYVTKMKMTEAARLLANTNKKIAEISEEVGYQDTNSFHIAFKKINGSSPALYRKKLSEKQ